MALSVGRAAEVVVAIALSAGGLLAAVATASASITSALPGGSWPASVLSTSSLPGSGGRMSGWDGGVQEGEEAGPDGQVLRVAVSADARASGATFISMNYQLEVGNETGAVPFTLLLFAPATAGEISARAGGEALPVRMTVSAGPRLEGEIELPAPLAGSRQLSLDVGYWVGDAVREEGEGVRIVLPMLAVDWAPAEARPGVFQAEVTLPEGMEAREIFPVTPSGETTPGVARASLQVLPALVQVRALPEGSLGLSLPGVLELLVLVVVVVCGMAGLRQVRRAAR